MHSVTECDPLYGHQSWPRFAFQSTHSVTECDLARPSPIPLGRYFNPRTPLQSAMRVNSKSRCLEAISIHALHYRVRFEAIVATDDNPVNFNPRTPLQSAINNLVGFDINDYISIHALHYRVRLHAPGYHQPERLDFNPRTPLQSAIILFKQRERERNNFNPRTPLQSAMLIDSQRYLVLLISIHALHYRVRSQDMVFWTPKSTSCD